MEWPIVISLYRLKLKEALGNLTFNKTCSECHKNETILQEYRQKHL